MATRRYAQGTQVPINRSRDEIERTLQRFGATGQLWGRNDETGVVTVAFKRQGRAYRFNVRLPTVEEMVRTPTGLKRSQGATEQANDAETRRRFRSLANYLKALLDATDTGIVVAEEALLGYMLLPSGETVYQRAQAQIGAGVEVDLSRALPPAH